MTPYLVVRDFDLRHTLESGQFFRWTHSRRGGYVVQTRDLAVWVRQDRDRLLFEGADAAFIGQFFSLDHDLRAVAAEIGRDGLVRKALRRFPGLRLIRQDPWECVAGFITSIASNIPRIRRNLADISKAAGRRIGVPDGTMAHTFPRPHEFPDERTLRSLRLGFRARYLAQAASLASAGMLEELAFADARSVREALMILPGVAQKVAECVALYAFGHLDSFPVDTWIRKIARRFLVREEADEEEIMRWGRRRYGRHAGYAQLYLYVLARGLGSDLRTRRRRADLAAAHA